MAVIGTLRDKAGTWVVVFVFVAISLFVLGDIFSGNTSILNWGRNTVGEIAGKEISYEEFQSVIRERENSFMMETGREPGEREMPGLREQAWELLIARHAIGTQFAEVGVQVTTDEVWDMIQGKNIDPTVRRSFTNEQTGQFERDRVVQYLKELQNPPVGATPQIMNMWQNTKAQWELFQANLRPARERIKYENLLIKSSYITKAEAERDYHLQTDVAEVKYLYVPFYAISDSSAQVSESDLEDYYNKNKGKFKTEASRDIKYVSFPVVPSADDSLVVRESLARAVNEFKTASGDSLYASTNTEGQEAFGKYTLANLPPYLGADSLVQGKVIGPILDGQTYKVIKVSQVFNDTIYSARAKHILIKWSDNSDAAKAVAKEQARAILKDIKAGADFGLKAQQFGTDGTKTRGGDLGWFSTGDMVKPFQDAVFGATKTGPLNDVVETDFGYHIIEVTNTKTNKAFKLAIVERELSPSDATTNEAFRKAEAFASGVGSVEEFEEKAGQEGVTVIEAKSIGAGDRRIGTLGEARQIVQWLFSKASVDAVSQVYDLQDQNVVAVMTGETEKGIKPLKQVEAEITPAVRNEVKGRMIIEKLNGLKGSLEEIAIGFGNDANVYTSNDLKLNSNAMPTVGFDPKAVGVAFSLENSKRSAPVAGENGVVIVEMQNKTIAPVLNDYSNQKAQLEQNSQNRASYSIAEAIKESSNIEDKRYKFY